MRTRVMTITILVLLLALPACGGAGLPGEPVTKAEDMLGVWHRTHKWRREVGQIYMQFRANGTVGFSALPDKWDYEWLTLGCAFEETGLSISEITLRGFSGGGEPQDYSCAGGYGEPSGIYEVQLLVNGNLKFANAQDNCSWRREMLSLAEWEPVQ